MKLLYTQLAITFSVGSIAQIPGYTLIADYPLTSDGVDATGNYANAMLENAPFQNGGCYSNGTYNDGTNNGTIIRLPNISALNPQGFIVTCEYQIDDLPDMNRPILLLGNSWRWLAAYTNTTGNGELYLFGNDGSNTQNSSVATTMGSYVSLQIRYQNGMAYLNINNTDIASMAYTPGHNSDFTMGCDHGGSGVAYKGHIRNIKVYNQDNVGIDENAFQAISFYPNPTSDMMNVNIPSAINRATLVVYDMIGKETMRSTVSGISSIDLSALKTGIYAIAILDEKGNLRSTRRIEKL